MVLTLENAQELLAGDDVIHLTYIYSWSSAKYWRLLKPIKFISSSGQEMEIPAGFVTDLSSVPRWLWGAAPPYGDFLLAALIHDYLYVYNIGTRREADYEMLVWSNAINDNRIDNKVRYWAVRLFGASWWSKTKKKDY